MPEMRIEWNIPGFHELRQEFAGECSQIGREMAAHANSAADAHNTNPEHPSGTYDSLDTQNAMRPVTYVRTADARGDLDEALHSTLTEATYSVKGREV